jgi:hypothetical protein
VSTTSSATAFAPNTYSVTVKDANNCTVVTSQTIGQPTAVTIAHQISLRVVAEIMALQRLHQAEEQAPIRMHGPEGQQALLRQI